MIPYGVLLECIDLNLKLRFEKLRLSKGARNAVETPIKMERIAEFARMPQGRTPD